MKGGYNIPRKVETAFCAIYSRQDFQRICSYDYSGSQQRCWGHDTYSVEGEGIVGSYKFAGIAQVAMASVKKRGGWGFVGP